jgi:type I restriction enzyme R subunit
MTGIIEDHIEQQVIRDLVDNHGYVHLFGPDIAPDGPSPERASYQEVVLVDRLRDAIRKLNPETPADTCEYALKEVLRITAGDVLTRNELFQDMLTNGVKVERRVAGEDRGDLVWLIDFNRPVNNQLVVCNQFTIIENNQNKRPDLVLFINGLPLVVIELKNAADENATIEKAYQQLQTYKSKIPSLFTYNGFLVISDGFEARAGTVTSDLRRYMSWKTEDGRKEASRNQGEIFTLVNGMLQPGVLLDLIRNFIVFEKHSRENPTTKVVTIETVKKLAAYHQYFAVNKALSSTISASAERGSRKGGVVWHTQGSGKSLSMVFYTGKLVASLNNPTVVVITDRNDLDEQLFDTFASATQLLRQAPVKAESREQLQKHLKVTAGGIVFTTIQKFFPEDEGSFPLLSDRRNIVVIADEAHRTQYGFEAKTRYLKDKDGNDIGTKISYGFAKHMHDALPNATFIGFTGTPVESTDKNTQAVFGEYVDVYDISQAVEDGATVPIYYESRLAKIHLKEDEMEKIDEELSIVAEGESEYYVEREKSKWTQLEAIVGQPERLRSVARDIVTHFEDRLTVFDGKGMIVTMSREIAVSLYREITSLRPEWHQEEDDKGIIKVIMTGSSSDSLDWQQHIRNKQKRKDIGDRLKDAGDPLKLVIVCDMWLTGFDAPPLHTLYVDKPMEGHNLMQAIARVNRVYGDKPGGLVVDYIGFATELKKALKIYTSSGGKGKVAPDLSEAVHIMLTKLEIVQQMMEGHGYQEFHRVELKGKLTIILNSVDHIFSLDQGAERFIREVTALSQAFALSKSTKEAGEIAEEVAFFQAVKARVIKVLTPATSPSDGDRPAFGEVIKQLVNRAVVSEGVVDILNEAGLKKPDLKILSDEFLEDVRRMKHKNLAAELLKKLLKDEIQVRFKRNVVESQKFSEMLQNSFNRYQSRFITLIEFLEELMKIAKEVKSTQDKGQKMNLTEDELAFYDALADNESALDVLGDESLRTMAKLLVVKVRENTSIDWTIRENARAKLRVIVRRVLREYGYPPDKTAAAVETVLEQAKLFASEWAAYE